MYFGRIQAERSGADGEKFARMTYDAFCHSSV